MNELFDELRLACPNWSFFEKDRFNIEQQGVYRLMYEEAAVQMKEAFEQHERRRRKSGEVS
ncbi:MAG: hypothetical protein ABL888_07230 [Pirellulaceae bacterium]